MNSTRGRLPLASSVDERGRQWTIADSFRRGGGDHVLPRLNADRDRVSVCYAGVTLAVSPGSLVRVASRVSSVPETELSGCSGRIRSTGAAGNRPPWTVVDGLGRLKPAVIPSARPL